MTFLCKVFLQDKVELSIRDCKFRFKLCFTFRTFCGDIRITCTVDLFVKPDANNAQRILDALSDFGFDSLDLKIQDFTEPGQIIQLGLPPARVDLITSISGVTWDEAEAGKIAGKAVGKNKLYVF